MSPTSTLLPVARPPASPHRDTVRLRSPGTLTVARGVALYTGALLGPGLLLLPGLAAAQAGPASVLAWLGLLGVSALLATVFAALGKAHPSEAGVAGYTAAGLGERAGAAAGWCFLAGVVAGAPVVCLIGASYVTRLAGGGRAAECAIAAGLLLVVLGLALAGIRATAGTQLVLVALLVVVIAGAVAGSAPSARAANWVPFAPHGWLALGHAAATLMLSFIGWEAVAPLTARFADPGRQLPRVIAAAFAVTTGLYLGLAVATIAVLGRGAGTAVPLAALLTHAIGRPGIAAAAVAAVVLTLGATNAYLTGAAALARELTGNLPSGPGHSRRLSGPGHPSHLGRPAQRRFLLLIAVAGIGVIVLFAAGVMTPAQLVAVPTTLFLTVYLGCTLSAVRVLRGAARGAAVPALLAVAAVLAFCGWALVVAGAVAVTAALARPGQSGDAQAGGDEPEGDRDRDVDDLGQQHLEPDEREHYGERLPEVREPVQQAVQQEVQRPQAQDGEGVRGEHEKRLGGDGEHRRDRVDGEDQVADLDEHQHDEQGGRHDAARPAYPEPLAVVPARRRDHPLDESGTAWLRTPALVAQHPSRGEEQERAEDVQHPLEPAQERRARGDHRRAHDQGAEHPQEQHPALVGPRYGETGEDQREDEDVVDGKALLQQIAAEVLPGALRSPGRPDHGAEAGPESDPDGAPQQRLARGGLARTAIREHVDGEHGEDGRERGRPDPRRHVHDRVN